MKKALITWEYNQHHKLRIGGIIYNIFSYFCTKLHVYLLYLKELDTLGRFLLYKGDNFCDFLFAFLTTKPLQKRDPLEKDSGFSLFK